MIAFIDDHRAAYGVEPICKVLPIAPSTYHAHVAKRADPTRLSARARRDDALNKVFPRRFRRRTHLPPPAVVRSIGQCPNPALGLPRAHTSSGGRGSGRHHGAATRCELPGVAVTDLPPPLSKQLPMLSENDASRSGSSYKRTVQRFALSVPLG
jgi:hypothetical protein